MRHKGAWGSAGMDLLILNLISSWDWVVSFTSRKTASRTHWIEGWEGYIHVPDDWEMCFLSRPVVEPGFFGYASCSLVTVLTAVSWLPNFLLAASNNRTRCSETLTDYYQVQILKRGVFQFIWIWRNVLSVTFELFDTQETYTHKYF
jgi:hypothetical protein